MIDMKKLFVVLQFLALAVVPMFAQTTWTGSTVKLKDNGVKYVYTAYEAQAVGDPASIDPEIMALTAKYARKLQDSLLFNKKYGRNVEMLLIDEFKAERALVAGGQAARTVPEMEEFDIRKVSWTRKRGGFGFMAGYSPSVAGGYLGDLTTFGGSVDLGFTVYIDKFYINPVLYTGRYGLADNKAGYYGNAYAGCNVFTDVINNLIDYEFTIFENKDDRGRIGGIMRDDREKVPYHGFSVNFGYEILQKGNTAFSAFAGPERKMFSFTTDVQLKNEYGETATVLSVRDLGGWGAVFGVAADWHFHRTLRFSVPQPKVRDSYLRASLYCDLICDNVIKKTMATANLSVCIGFMSRRIKEGQVL